MEVIKVETTGWVEHLKPKPGVPGEFLAKKRWAATNGGFLLLYKSPQQNVSKLDRKAACGGAMLPAAGDIALQSDVVVRIFNKENTDVVMTLRFSTAVEGEKWLAVLLGCQKKVVEVDNEVEIGEKENAEGNNAVSALTRPIGGVVVMRDGATAAAEREARAALEDKARLEAERENMRREIAQLQKRQRASEEIIKLQQQKMKSSSAPTVQPAVLAERLRLLTEDKSAPSISSGNAATAAAAAASGLAAGPVAVSAAVSAADEETAPSSSSKPTQKGAPSTTAGGDGESRSHKATTTGNNQASADPTTSVHALRVEAERAEAELAERKAAQEAEEQQRSAEIRRLRSEADRIQREEEEARERARAEAELERIRIEAAARAAEEERQRIEDERERARISLALATKQAADRQYEELLKHKQDLERRGRICRAAEDGNIQATGQATVDSTTSGRGAWSVARIAAAVVLSVAVLLVLTVSILDLGPGPRPIGDNSAARFTSSMGQERVAATSRPISFPMQGSTSTPAGAAGPSAHMQQLARDLAPDEVEVLIAADRIMAKAAASQTHSSTHGLPASGSGSGSRGLGQVRAGSGGVSHLTNNADEREADLAKSQAALAFHRASGDAEGQALAFREMLRSLLSALTSPIRAIQRVFSWLTGSKI